MNHRLLYWMMVSTNQLHPMSFYNLTKSNMFCASQLIRTFIMPMFSFTISFTSLYFCFRITFVLSHKYCLYLCYLSINFLLLSSICFWCCHYVSGCYYSFTKYKMITMKQPDPVLYFSDSVLPHNNFFSYWCIPSIRPYGRWIEEGRKYLFQIAIMEWNESIGITQIQRDHSVAPTRY